MLCNFKKVTEILLISGVIAYLVVFLSYFNPLALEQENKSFVRIIFKLKETTCVPNLFQALPLVCSYIRNKSEFH